jgi:hypothetical protein
MQLRVSLKNRFRSYIHKQVIRVLRKKGRKDDDGGIKAFLLGLGLGTIGYGILSLFVKPRCPDCNSEIQKYASQCPNCKMYLQWE